MSLAEYYAACLFSKGKPRVVAKLEKDRALKATETRVRRKVNRRDKHRCFWPGCRKAAFHKHHKVYRSHGGRWDTANVISGCGTHHRWVHDGLIRVSGNPDVAPVDIMVTALGRAARIKLPRSA